MAIPRRRLIDRSVQQRDARLFLIVTEGARTEPDYLRALEEARMIPVERVRLRVHGPENGASAPRHLVEQAVKHREAITPWQSDDEVWLLFDVDLQSGSNREAQVRETAQDAGQRGWNVAVSNPCFELWYLLHAEAPPTQTPATCNEVGQAVRAALGSYNKTHVPFAALDEPRLRAACAAAEARDLDPNAPVPPHGVTRVYRLLNTLRTLARP
jgi:hypothetical protein